MTTENSRLAETTIAARPFCPYEVATPGWLAEHCHAARKGVCIASRHLRRACWAEWDDEVELRRGLLLWEIEANDTRIKEGPE